MQLTEKSAGSMNWSIHRVSLPTHSLAEARAFFESHLGLGHKLINWIPKRSEQ